jgi:hypothetical protein
VCFFHLLLLHLLPLQPLLLQLLLLLLRGLLGSRGCPALFPLALGRGGGTFLAIVLWTLAT